jgi:hypothetical protein
MNDFYLLAASETSNLAALFRGWRDDTMEFVPIRVPMILVKTLLNKQYPVSRELRRRIKNCFQKNNIQTAGPGRICVMGQGEAKAF